MNQVEKELWPGWKTGQVIGKGSFGAVYEIENAKTGEKAALKKISIPQSESELEEMYADGFTRETVASNYTQQRNSIMWGYSFMQELSGCPNVVRCDDSRYEQHEDGIGWDIYIKMELLTPLTKIVTDDMPEEQVLKLGTDLCKALELCKENGVLHRDIKPQNIFMSPEGEYKLGDFGIAKAAEGTMGGTKIGTYKYMAPEVYNNQPYGAGADIYSLGLVLYWLLNARRMPFAPLPPIVPTHSDEEAAKLRRFTGSPLPAPLHGSEDLKQVVLKACAFDPKDRYRSAAQMRQDLEAIMRGEPVYLAAAAGDGTVNPARQQNRVQRQFCKNCGAPVFPNVKFCRKCGAEIAVVPVDLPEKEKTVPPPVPPSKKTGPDVKKLVIAGIIGCGVLVVGLILLLILVPLSRYNKAVELMDSGDYQGAISTFEKLDDYKDSTQKIKECRYYQAVTWFNEGKYREAQAEFETLGSYEDSADMVTQCKYGQAVAWYGKGKYADALAVFESLGDYEDSMAMVTECKYGQADNLLSEGKYDEALAAFEALGNYPDKVKACKYGQAVTLMDGGKYGNAIALFEEIGDYQDAADKAKECKYNCATAWLNEGNVVDAYETFSSLGDYKDSADKAKSVEKTYKRIQNKSKVFRSGTWWDEYSKRCYMKTSVVDNDTVSIEISWSSSADTVTKWFFTGKWDPATGKLNYTGGEQYGYYYPSWSSNVITNCIYSDGSGYFYYEYGYLYWVDYKESAGQNCYFEYSYY